MAHAHVSSDVSLAQSPSTEKRLTRDVLARSVSPYTLSVCAAAVVLRCSRS